MLDWFFLWHFCFWKGEYKLLTKCNQNETYIVNDNIITELLKKSIYTNTSTCIELGIKMVLFTNYLLQFLI